MYRYSYDVGSVDSPEFWLFFGITMLIVGLVVLIVSVITMVGQWQVFKKAGKPGWAAIIPIYNMWVLYEIGDVKPVFCLLTVAGGFLVGISNSLLMFAGKNVAFVFVSIPLSIISMVCSIAGLVFSIKSSLGIARHFGKSDAYGLGLAFLSVIFYPMLGFDKKAEYK